MELGMLGMGGQAGGGDGQAGRQEACLPARPSPTLPPTPTTTPPFPTQNHPTLPPSLPLRLPPGLAAWEISPHLFPASLSLSLSHLHSFLEVGLSASPPLAFAIMISSSFQVVLLFVWLFVLVGCVWPGWPCPSQPSGPALPLPPP